ncbi:citrulline utilization hydrolase CtlX [Lewinella sp. JB7]|uniref:citrulline utilization hydrolase CtlX n=1 Tax=Lewinella sp. JB7 TaxID=2962887 RepID=UPI0020C9F38A|nr:arginine deiminase-related protein [Lewinella sp. JB7]MCP9235333.1 arginine deiminase-related protein [Lewinella sp. JB7]
MQTTRHLLMVRPANFARASETVADNSFQEPVSNESFRAIGERAVQEFDHFVELLRRIGVEVTVIEDTPAPVKPDAVFPNNWFSTHPDGTLVTYPTYWPQRRLERRDDVVDFLKNTFRVARHVDLSAWEEDERYLESTGSLLLDRDRLIAYACLSQRCTRVAVHDWCEIMGYKPITFHAHDARGEVIYHTNVMMALGTTHAIVCLDALRDEAERSKLTESLILTGKRIVELSLDQVDQFAGNALEVSTEEGPVWIMSSAAFGALTEEQRQTLVAPPGTRIVHADLSTIERYGGGSARCMLGEVYLEPR